MEIVTLKKIWKKFDSFDRVLVYLALFGVIIAFVSLFRGILMDRQVQVEYLNDGGKALGEKTSLYVDVEGAVINPGVYGVLEGSRIKDALIAAGGMSGLADRDYCEKNINMAEYVKDGQKIYIPILKNTNAQDGYNEANSGLKMICINTATVEELDTLSGIGSVRAQDIVKNRPYSSLDDLITKGVLSKSIVDQNRDLMSVY